MEEQNTALEIGKLVKGKGIYVGEWKPKDRDGRTLGKTFDLYAAPEDLTDSESGKSLLMFSSAVKYVAGLCSYHGYNGFNHNVEGKTPDEALYDALRTGNYKNEWFIPPNDLLNTNLYRNKDEFKVKNALTARFNGSDRSHRYWSSTEPTLGLMKMPGDRGVSWQDFSNGSVDWSPKDTSFPGQSTRLVRAELQP